MLKMAIVINDSIEMSCGKTAAQAAHAAVECAFKAYAKKPSIVKKWLEEGQKKVVLKAEEEEIIKLESKARSLGLTTAIIRDAGLTELEPGTLTALAIGPGEEDKVDKITGHLPLK